MTDPRQRYVEAAKELENIANAKRFDRECFADDTEFADWAQSRARHYAAIASALADALEQAEPVNRPDFPNVLVIELPEEPTTR